MMGGGLYQKSTGPAARALLRRVVLLGGPFFERFPGVSDGGADDAWLEGFAKDATDAGEFRRLGILCSKQRRNDDDWEAAWAEAIAKLREKSEAVDPWHEQIHEHHARLGAVGQC
jgi:uncharacterized protein YbjT (DUF2867 family)